MSIHDHVELSAYLRDLVGHPGPERIPPYYLTTVARSHGLGPREQVRLFALGAASADNALHRRARATAWLRATRTGAVEPRPVAPGRAVLDALGSRTERRFRTVRVVQSDPTLQAMRGLLLGAMASIQFFAEHDPSARPQDAHRLGVAIQVIDVGAAAEPEPVVHPSVVPGVPEPDFPGWIFDYVHTAGLTLRALARRANWPAPDVSDVLSDPWPDEHTVTSAVWLLGLPTLEEEWLRAIVDVGPDADPFHREQAEETLIGRELTLANYPVADDDHVADVLRDQLMMGGAPSGTRWWELEVPTSVRTARFALRTMQQAWWRLRTLAARDPGPRDRVAVIGWQLVADGW